MKKIIIVFVLLLQQYLFANNDTYSNTQSGIAFEYPDYMKMETKSKGERPLKLLFTYGEKPFSVSILFNEVEGVADMNDFIQKEHRKQRDGKYQNEIVEKRYKIDERAEAVEFVRDTPFGTIYYFVFPSNHKLYTFYHLTSKNADPDKQALKAYDVMKKSLKVSH